MKEFLSFGQNGCGGVGGVGLGDFVGYTRLIRLHPAISVGKSESRNKSGKSTGRLWCVCRSGRRMEEKRWMGRRSEVISSMFTCARLYRVVIFDREHSSALLEIE